MSGTAAVARKECEGRVRRTVVDGEDVLALRRDDALAALEGLGQQRERALVAVEGSLAVGRHLELVEEALRRLGEGLVAQEGARLLDCERRRAGLESVSRRGGVG
jgi:hypothetical protein